MCTYLNYYVQLASIEDFWYWYAGFTGCDWVQRTQVALAVEYRGDTVRLLP